MTRIFFCLLLLLASCAAPEKPSSLRIAFQASPATLDPRKANDFISCSLMCLLYEGLMRNCPDGSVEPALAERVEISHDLLVYTFYLRDAFWSDGKKVTAYELEASWKKGIAPEFPSLCAYLFYPIKHAEKALRKEKPLEDVGIRALDEKTFQVELERPCPYFLSLTAFSSFFPIPLDLQENNLDQVRPLVVNGPFCLEMQSTHAKLLLKKNPRFWNRDSIRLEEISIHIVPDETTALHLFERQELDWIGGALSPISLDALSLIKKKRQGQFSPTAATTFCTFNTHKSPFDCKELRQALSLAINREEIIEHITQMGEISATRCLPPALMEGKNKHLYPSYDPKQAQALFSQACLTKKFPPATLVFKSHPLDKQIAQLLQQQWRKVLGIHIELQEVDVKTHKKLLLSRNYDLSLSNWIAQVNDPINILERFKDLENSKNYPAWQDARFTNLVQAALETTQKEQRLQWIEAAEEVFAQAMPLAPIYHWTSFSLCQPRVKNLYTTPTGGVLFERSWISES